MIMLVCFVVTCDRRFLFWLAQKFKTGTPYHWLDLWVLLTARAISVGWSLTLLVGSAMLD